jgi:hypothetical protein
MNRQKQNQRNAITMLIVVGGFLIIILAIAIGSVGSGGTPAPLMTQLAIQQTQMALRQTLTAGARPITPIPPVTVPPITVPPVVVPPATQAPVTVPLPSGVIKFSDNFDNGFSPLWQVKGEWIFNNGQPVFTGRPRCDGMLLVGDVTWDNYAIEFDKIYDSFDLLFGYKDEKNFYYLRDNLSGSGSFSIIETINGTATTINTSGRNSFPSGKLYLEIHGNHLKMYTVDSYGDVKPIYEFQLAHPLNGRVGFETCYSSGAVLDNFKVTSQP